MPNLIETENATYTSIPTFSCEIETVGNVAVSEMKSDLRAKGITGCKVTYDGSGCTEVVPAPMAPSQTAWNYLETLCNAINEIGTARLGDHNRLIKSKCGLHVHVGASFLKSGICPDQFTAESLQYMTDTGKYIGKPEGNSEQREQRSRLFADPFDVELVRDIVLRYFLNTTAINKILTYSRRNNRYAYPLTTNGRLTIERINACRDVQELEQLLATIHVRYTAINLIPYADLGTIEFRQHQGTTDYQKIRYWIELLNNFVLHSAENRIEQGTASTTEATPEALPVRRGTRLAVQYDMMRSEHGATTQEMMDATGVTEQRIRAAVSEIRNRVGQSAVVTHTQQANGATYGDGTHHTRYQVPLNITVQGSGTRLMSENRRGGTSIWCGVSDERFAWWQQRAIEIEEAEQRRRNRRR